MDRKSFLKKAAMGTAAAITGGGLTAKAKSTYDKLMEPVGFNHLPNKEMKRMKSVLHKASSRGHANHGWLDSHHSFSFANYYNPERVHFGVLRVLNDDVVAAGRGFGTHPHDNMEIISIPLEGELEHKDSMGNVAVIRAGEVQAMSAGTGIYHSEYNKNRNQDVKFLQIWLFPNRKNVEPRYDQIRLAKGEQEAGLQQILSPNPDDAGVWIHQEAWFHLGNIAAGQSETYRLKRRGNGIYVFILNGKVKVDGQELESRDGYGVWETSEIRLEASADARVLLMDVPMEIG